MGVVGTEEFVSNLPLGSGESGKSTIVKQMKIIHQNGYSMDELAMYRLTIYKNLVDCAKALVQALRQFNIEPEGAINKVRFHSSQYLLRQFTENCIGARGLYSRIPSGS
jgi:hypothetical protein